MVRIHVAASMNMDLAAYSDSLPRPGETVFGRAVAWSPGGKGLNQAVAAARLGGDVAMLGFLGDDEMGAKVRAFLAAEGIDISCVGTLAGVASGLAVILVDKSSQNAIVVIPGANMAWPTEATTALAARRGDLVLATFEIPDAQIVAAFRRARAAGAKTVLNPAPARAASAELMALTDQLILNEVELPMILGRPVDPADLAAVERATRELVAGRDVVIVTLGDAGAVVVTPAAAWHVPPVPVTAIDTAAAGDCFIGAWAAALARGADVRAAATYANRAAAVSVTRRGTAVSLPRVGEVSGA